MGVCKVSIRYECKHRRYLGRRRSCPHGHGTEDDKQDLMAELDHGIEDDKQDLRARVQIHEILLNLVHTKVGL